MNKVIQANLGGIAFTFDDDAYEDLDDYLDAINGYFRGSSGHADIMHDIEARLAELFTQNLKGRSIVTVEDVSLAVSTLGTPEQFAGEAATDDAEEDEAEDDFSYRRRSRRNTRYSPYGKKLMRDPDAKVLGGVCSGLSAYFGVENPVWIRLAFAAAFLGAGFGAGLYILLWIIMPLAVTAGDKLAMRGEPIDLNTISEQVEREAVHITSRIQEWGEEVNKTDWSKKFGKQSGWSKRPNKKSRRKQEPQNDEYMK